MNTPVSFAVSLAFILVTIVTILTLYRASNKNKKVLYVLVTWTLIQGVIGFSGFYLDTNAIPPRFPLLIAPAIAGLIFLFNSKRGKEFIDSLDPAILTVLHTIRIPVEIILFALYSAELIPEIMTYSGQNFDIIAGITAPLIFWFYYRKPLISKSIVLIWNVAMLLLLFNIVITALLAAPLPFQQICFDDPNIGLMYFPFIWLPSTVVPIVILAHFASIRSLLKK